MTKLIDLHIHSTYSDGDYTPNRLIRIAQNKNIQTISITDHDTVLAYKNLAPQELVEVIPGVELSAKDEIGKMHILGYGINPFDKQLIQATDLLRENNIENLLKIVDYLKDKGIFFNQKDISCLINKAGDVGRVPLARLIVDYGYSETVRTAFDEYLNDAFKATKAATKNFTYQECLKLIIDAGGIPILAHPYTLKRSDKELEALVKEMIKYGLMGLEVFHSEHRLQTINKYYNLVNKYDLLYSCGTDYHGERTKPDIEMGTGKEKKLVLTNCTVLDYIKNRK